MKILESPSLTVLVCKMRKDHQPHGIVNLLNVLKAVGKVARSQ